MQAKGRNPERRPPLELAGSDPTTKRMDAMLHATEILVERALQEERSVSKLVAAVREVEGRADEDIEKFQVAVEEAVQHGRGDPIQCKARCSHCCYRVPEATIPEVAVIWDHVENQFSEKQKLALRERTLSYLEATQPFRPSNLGRARAACPLLVDDKCSVYESRPLTCRGLNSTNVAACEAIRRGQELPSQRPKWPDQEGIASVTRLGMRLGVFFEYLEAPVVDLGHALSVLFERPDACEHYVAGKDFFLQSRSGHETEGFDGARISITNGAAFLPKRELELPSGNITPEEAAFYRTQNDLLLQEGRFEDSMRGLRGRVPSRMIARINVPRVAMSEAEIDETRVHFVRAMREYKAERFAPTDSFNALSLHQTMNLTYQGRNDLEILRDHGRFVVDGISARALPAFAHPPEGKRRPGKLRVGFLSGNLNSSNGGRWAWTWVKHQGDDIETFSFLTGVRSDGITDRFRLLSDHFYWMNRSVPENAAFIRDLDLDVMIFTDIGLFARNTQYSSLRLAPVQCTAWGHPETSGLPTIDYYLSSDLMEPKDGDQHYTEKLIRLPRAGLLFYREAMNVPDHDRAHFGLPEKGPVILMGQSCMKLVPKYDHLYAEICDRLDTEIIFLEANAAGDTILLKKRLQAAGVRARWLPALSNADYMALLKLSSASIDPPMWSGGNSTVQALMLGTPVVTLPGPLMRGRHSLAFLQLANAPGLVAKDEKDYVDLVCDMDRLKEASKNMDAEPIFGDTGTVQALDEFLLSAGARS